MFILADAANVGDQITCNKGAQSCDLCAQGSAAILNLFQLTGSYCQVKDCSKSSVGNNLNGSVCASCQATATDITPLGPYFDGTQCVQECSPGLYASDLNGFNCQVANPGQPVNCSMSQSCYECGLNNFTINQFNFDQNSKLCNVFDCSSNAATILNGWVCNSCKSATGTGNIPKGQYYDDINKTCADTCPPGQSASEDTQFVCSPPPNPGTEVGCSTDQSTCSGCGDKNQYLRIFNYKSGNNCSVKDCHAATIGPFLNGWVCNSCSQASGDGNIPKGQYFDGTTCVTNCPDGYSASASTGYTCYKNPKPVACSKDSSTCAGCGDTPSLQNLFTYSGGNTCTVKDCSQKAIGATQNGWICQSCSAATGINLIPSGQYYGKSCISNCGKGYSVSQATGFNCIKQNPGQLVACSNDNKTCNGCGSTNDIQKLFAIGKGSTCGVIDCSSVIVGSNLNGWVCNSCSTAVGTGNIISGQYYDGTNCVTTCPIGSNASKDTGFVCLYPPSPGASVACSSDSSTCGGCGTTSSIQGLFKYGTGKNCSVTDCNLMIVGSNLNGWVCNSCSQSSGVHNIAKGQYYNGKTCVDSCPTGQQASIATGYVCQNIPNPGTPVTCSNDSSTCGACGSTNTISTLFTHGTGNNCYVSDCTASVVGSNLNGWVCNSCSSATGSGNITTGQFFNGTTCVASCPPGQQANLSTGWVCQPIIANPGSDVTCSNDSQTCAGCGLTSDIQKLFIHGTQNKCSVVDCSAAVVGSNLNGWVCNSCSTAKGQNNIATGQYYNGTTCVASCLSGQSASASTGYVCKADSSPAPVNNNASQSSIICYALVFAMLKLLI
ncbi:hypothetical protein TTHERM_00635690 (macronuclear) [Tetrahymena thermophila SB210]|uniref:Immobilization antigen n=1 Tax=Tetrahymena thermophila (strain SB210) TaxID=312017 RepID=Q22WY2_TETTS|nr:hypothetical protein TTHERM_00635690 [Tetrahymena thermophila SB210]EAR89864.2 hypothetical protein TTHERM_00635690 [Tetrahymena thermophila SB210]|eukprot:XP_001010109.2 hypothetical protein TTHERM_00635690 [Tetrahymena thermophila SB210]